MSKNFKSHFQTLLITLKTSNNLNDLINELDKVVLLLIENKFSQEEKKFLEEELVFDSVKILWERKNFPKEHAPKVNKYFQRCLIYSAYKVHEENPKVLDIFNRLFLFPTKKAFYSSYRPQPNEQFLQFQVVPDPVYIQDPLQIPIKQEMDSQIEVNNQQQKENEKEKEKEQQINKLNQNQTKIPKSNNLKKQMDLEMNPEKEINITKDKETKIDMDIEMEMEMEIEEEEEEVQEKQDETKQSKYQKLRKFTKALINNTLERIIKRYEQKEIGINVPETFGIQVPIKLT
ncbi:hypothetical protein M0813_09456 [Anaeramoeba flamelloides]|uniref:Uncharacterized protein n=1 Tax=Anaeramoeba flamelloides TaxID=1746091 RepID=A0ABQ8X5H0_9EUKA|nr:hypothetical protein M0813_09456 [Anaeramoeba flamelloides]